MVDSALTKHVRSVQSLASEVAAEGRHEDAWQISRDSAASVIAASPGSPNHKMLKLALKLAEQEKDMGARADIMQHAFDEVLDKSSVSPNGGLSQSGTALRRRPAADTSMGTLDQPMTPLRRHPMNETLMETPDRPSLAMGLSRPSMPHCLSRHYTQSRPSSSTVDRHGASFRSLPSELPRVQREEPEVSPDANLQFGSTWETDRMLGGSAGNFRPSLTRASSAPYFVNTPLGAGTQRGTSHYTRLGGPRTNQNFVNTLPGANREFVGRDPWKTSTQVFYQDPEGDPEPVRRRDANFQYFNGNKYQGVATVRERVRLPAHHDRPFSFC